MSVEIPVGDAAPEQATIRKDSENKASSSGMSWKKWFVPVLLVLIVAATLIAVLPDWDGQNNDEVLQQEEEALGQEEDHVAPAEQYLVSNKGPFDVKIPLFSSRVTEGYDSPEELEQDLQQLVGLLLNTAIITNQEAGSDVQGFPVLDGDGATIPEQGEKGEMTTTVAGSDSTLSDVDSYETNNQEFTIDRADFVKSDGSLVFAAYGDYLVVWATEGPEIITKIQMPPLNITGYYEGPIVEPRPADDTNEEGSQPGETTGTENNATDAKTTTSARSSMMIWNPKPRIEALLLHQDRLTVVISGYGMENVQSLGYVPILYEYLGTRIQIYDVNSGSLQLVSETDVNGAFRNAYSVDGNVYVVTQSYLNTWEHLLAPIQRWQPYFVGLDDDAYIQNVTALVDDGLVDDFIDRLLLELQVNGPIDLARLSVFADAISEDNVDESLYSGGIANAITQVVAFDMAASSSGNGVAKLVPQISGTFHPGSWGQVYAMGSMIIVADQGWSWIEVDGQAAQKTYLVCFSLNGPSSAHALVGSVDGYLLNPYSLDYVEKPEGSYVRIATTQSFWTPWVGILEGDVAVEAEETVAAVAESNTVNQIIVLRVPSAPDASGERVLQQVGSLQLGEPNEMFTAVRFFDDFAYAVTFERIDPFYVVDLTGEQPVKAGELKVTGFSQYLHPIDSNDQYLVALGQDSDEDGNVLGLQISLFDATTASNPILMDRLVVEQEQNTWSDSSASWDERAFRFVSLGDRKGKVIIPLSTYTWQEFDEVTGEPLSMPLEQNFEGFSVFNIENDVITKDFDVDHSFDIPYASDCNFWYDWLPERSFVFNGKLMTIKKYTIISTDLSTGETLWTVPVNATIPAECYV